ncbi:MAG TPA: DNA polymerase IV [Sediminispirochaeta sp.]|nr:DNA polymerase IV [Sediminispirochaeta sp.]
MGRIFFHVDMDAFYAAVEQSDQPELQGKPVIIGARPGSRGVVSACSYEARVYGVHSAMPISEAYRRCPHGVFLPGRMGRYQEVSREIMRIFEDFSPDIQQISIDEAFLDMTGTERLFGPPVEAAKKLKSRVRHETGLVISVGIAANKLLAKLASDYNKPDGLYMVNEEKKLDFIDSLKLKDLWGIGKKTIARLEELGITDPPSLRAIDRASLIRLFGNAGGDFLYRLVRGEDPGILPKDTKSRSLSGEVTFERDTSDSEVIRQVILDLSHQVMFRMIDQKLQSSTVFIKVRYSDFSTFSVQKKLRHPIYSAEEINQTAYTLLRSRWTGGREIRLVGVGVSGVLSAGQEPRQQELFSDPQDRKKKVEKAVHRLRAKGNRIDKASLLDAVPEVKKREEKRFSGPAPEDP